MADVLSLPAAHCEIDAREVWRRFWTRLAHALLHSLPAPTIVVGQGIVAGFPPIAIGGLGGASLLIALVREVPLVVAGIVEDVDGLVELAAEYELIVDAQIALRHAMAAWLDARSLAVEPATEDARSGSRRMGARPRNRKSLTTAV